MTDTGVVQRVPVSAPAAPPGAAAGSAVASTTKPGELAVRETARQLAAASISGNTQRAYAGAMRRLGEHLAGAELTDATLADYLARLFELGRSPASAAMLVAAVRFQVRVTGSDSPVGAATDRVLAGFRRAGSDRGRGQVAGVRWGQADAAAAVAANGGESIHGLRDAAILAVASDAMLRLGACRASRGRHRGRRRQRRHRDGAPLQDGSGRRRRGVVSRATPPRATDQRDGWVLLAFLPTTPTRRCFSASTGGGTPRGQLSARSLRRIITARCSAAGVEGRISGHSLRVGSASRSPPRGLASRCSRPAAGNHRPCRPATPPASSPLEVPSLGCATGPQSRLCILRRHILGAVSFCAAP